MSIFGYLNGFTTELRHSNATTKRWERRSIVSSEGYTLVDFATKTESVANEPFGHQLLVDKRLQKDS